MAIDTATARTRAVDAVKSFYGTEHAGPHDHRNAELDARAAVTFAVDIAGITHREIASLAGVPGLLVAKLITTPETYVSALRLERHAAERYVSDVLGEIRQAAVRHVNPDAGRGGRGIQTQGGFAKAAGVDRMAVRGWIGKR